jgi:2-keto-4-pentenoate hydratase
VTLAPAVHAEIVESLWGAHRGGDLVAPPTAGVPDLDEGDAYAIQESLVARWKAHGEVEVGWKVGLTSAIGRRARPVGPIYGQLLAGMVVAEGEPIVAADLFKPEVEGEIAFLLDRPLQGPGVTVADVLAATRAVLPAIEIIAGRLSSADLAVADFVADNAFSARVVLGGTPLPVDGLDLRLLGMVQSSGGEVVATGAGARVLGHPAKAVAWLADALAVRGRRLEAGAFVLSGSLAPAVPALAGDAFTVEIDRLGAVSAVFA